LWRAAGFPALDANVRPSNRFHSAWRITLPTTRAYPETAGQQLEQGWRFGWVDAVIIMAVCVLLWLLAVLGGDMRVRFDELNPPAISLDLEYIPYYTARTVLRMMLAFAAALLLRSCTATSRRKARELAR